MRLIEEHNGMLFKVCRIYQDDDDDRSDLMQEIVLQLWLYFDSFKGQSKVNTWMYRVALNTAITFFKKQKRRPDSERLHHIVDHPEEHPEAIKDEQLGLFYKAIKHLNKVEKALIFLYMENQSYEDIAFNLGITEGNARVRLNRIKIKLREIIKTFDYEY